MNTKEKIKCIFVSASYGDNLPPIILEGVGK